MKQKILLAAMLFLAQGSAHANGLDWFANRLENFARCARKELSDDLRDDDNDHISSSQRRRLKKEMKDVVRAASDYAAKLRREDDSAKERNELRDAIRNFWKKFKDYDVDDGWNFNYCWDELKQRAHKNPGQLPDW